MATLPAKLKELLETLELVADRNDRIDLLIGIAERFEPVPERIATRPYGEDHKVPACESEAYVWAESQQGGTLKFYFAVENPQGISAKAMAAILDDTLSGQPLAEVAAVGGDVVYRIFGDELSMGKSMGLMGMVTMVQTSARKALAALG